MISETIVNISNKVMKSLNRLWSDFIVHFFFRSRFKATVKFLILERLLRSRFF